MCFTKAWEKLEIVLPFTDENPNSPIEIDLLSTWKKWIQNYVIRELIKLKLINKEHYESLKNWWIDDERIINWLWARAIKNWVKYKFDEILNPKIKDKWDKL